MGIHIENERVPQYSNLIKFLNSGEWSYLLRSVSDFVMSFLKSGLPPYKETRGAGGVQKDTPRYYTRDFTLIGGVKGPECWHSSFGLTLNPKP